MVESHPLHRCGDLERDDYRIIITICIVIVYVCLQLMVIPMWILEAFPDQNLGLVRQWVAVRYDYPEWVWAVLFLRISINPGKISWVSNDRIMWLIFYPFVRKTIKNSCLFVCLRLALQCFVVLVKRFFRPPPHIFFAPFGRDLH